MTIFSAYIQAAAAIIRPVAAVLAVCFADWSADVLPLVGAGPVTMPGFAALVLTVLLALLAGVVWFMVISPARRQPAPAGPRHSRSRRTGRGAA